ncbi:hypothetical protein AQUCO_00100334v1 [Aquilegia coerulea]|uniref:Uncharacterized protein n=1 Tax=Aquilegia coerulea TaxID=218851 RepID=A0A2G5FA25_AQUCA|nr:hypothetical protein AQUCO_00100334v1 [Aquilegia coerulea]
MASLSSSLHFSISNKSMQPHQSADLNTSCASNIRTLSCRRVFNELVPKSWKLNRKKQGNCSLLRSSVLFRLMYTCHESVSPMNPKRCFSSVASDHINCESVLVLDNDDNRAVKYNQIDELVGVLHNAARSFSVAIKCHESASSPELAKAWVGVDVHAWHKHIAYQAAVCALLKTAIEARFLLSGEQRSEVSSVHDIISPKVNMLLKLVENELNARDQNLAKWFKIVKLPILEGLFIPLLKRRSAEHDGSGVAVIFLAICCCVAVEKLGTQHDSCPKVTLSIPNIVGELMDLSHSLAPIDKLHSLATVAGVEQQFLLHFGAKVLPNKDSQEMSFWIGLVQKKLSVAFQRESVISRMHIFRNKQDIERDLATLGLFAFLGNRTRLFLSGMGIKDLDEQAKDFLSYLECGSLFIYPDFSSLRVYQHFMEVVAEEIGWLDLYAAVPCISHHERRRSKQHAIQAEKEIILSAVFTVCSDMFSGFAHFSNSTQQSLDGDMVAFLDRSRNLLTICLEDYWAAYYRSGELLKYAERFIPQAIIPFGNRGTTNVSALNELLKKSADLMAMGIRVSPHCESKSSNQDGIDAITIVKSPCSSETKSVHENMFRNYSNKLKSMIFDILIGTQLLFIDISIASGLLLKQMRGHMLTERERKKLKRTLADFVSVIPVTILMLLPVSTSGIFFLFSIKNPLKNEEES